jgi:hypothetical protein
MDGGSQHGDTIGTDSGDRGALSRSRRADKRRILDEFVAVTSYHRKHAIRVLNRREQRPSASKSHSRHYGSDVREALIVLWEASERLCSKRLKPLIPVLLPALERHGRLAPDDVLHDKLLTVSSATIDRLLTEVRIVARGGQRRRAGMSSAVRCSVPVRTFGDWNDPPPGFVEVDFVAHSGTSSSELRADDGADRHCHRLDRMHSGPHARQRQRDHGNQAGALPVSLSAAGCRL